MQRGEIRRDSKRSCTALRSACEGRSNLRGYGASASLRRTTEPVHRMLACSMQDANPPAPAPRARYYVMP